MAPSLAGEGPGVPTPPSRPWTAQPSFHSSPPTPRTPAPAAYGGPAACRTGPTPCAPSPRCLSPAPAESRGQSGLRARRSVWPSDLARSVLARIQAPSRTPPRPETTPSPPGCPPRQPPPWLRHATTPAGTASIQPTAHHWPAASPTPQHHATTAGSQPCPQPPPRTPLATPATAATSSDAPDPTPRPARPDRHQLPTRPIPFRAARAHSSRAAPRHQRAQPKDVDIWGPKH
ncbi:autotransporter [Streptomyces sp. OM5714]|nr:autotransporter [Streptomyces sp. OM5714]